MAIVMDPRVSRSFLVDRAPGNRSFFNLSVPGRRPRMKTFLSDGLHLRKNFKDKPKTRQVSKGRRDCLVLSPIHNNFPFPVMEPTTRKSESVPSVIVTATVLENMKGANAIRVSSSYQ